MAVVCCTRLTAPQKILSDSGASSRPLILLIGPESSGQTRMVQTARQGHREETRTPRRDIYLEYFGKPQGWRIPKTAQGRLRSEPSACHSYLHLICEMLLMFMAWQPTQTLQGFFGQSERTFSPLTPSPQSKHASHH